MNVFKALLRSRKVWLAVVGVVQTLAFATMPDFDPAVWQAINVLLLAVIAGIAVEDAAEKLQKTPEVHILPAALESTTSAMEGDPASMQTPSLSSDGDLLRQPPPSVRAWMPPEPETDEE